MARRSRGGVSEQGQVDAILGPTNTGKTHQAIQRMLKHRTGMIGLPLRLLAREVYERVVAAKGSDQVALVTGEEKIVPPGATFWVCTVEAMPVDRPVSFLAVDEIQLAADPARGHVFTDRLLHARGLVQTCFLGADTMEDLISTLVPDVRIRSLPRLSALSYAGPRKLAALPPRSAVVGFGVQRVYELAERLRVRHGGAAVVTGALSPRARNAQVELFQSGRVRHLVATDAIGMGLNLDVHHVALAGRKKFDGRRVRPLRADELAQIAGRAGRHRRDGTFGETAGLGALDPELVAAIEQHDFPSQTQLVWRHPHLDFRSIEGLQRSLHQAPPRRELVMVRRPDDAAALDALAVLPEVQARATSPDRVALLWEVCGIPDFGKVMAEAHAGLLSQIFAHLVDGEGTLPAAWLDGQLRRLDRTEGDLETLTSRIAGVRTWTFVANKGSWTPDPAAWQARTRDLEDRLSDALHARLTERFVDDRASVLVGALREPSSAPTVDAEGEVQAGGRVVGRLLGTSFHAEDARSAPVRKAVRALVAPLVQERLEAILEGPDEALDVDEDGVIRWQEAGLARLVAGVDWRRPRVRLLRHESLDGQARGALAARLDLWMQRWLDGHTAALAEVSLWMPGARGVVEGLIQGGGSLDRHRFPEVLGSLSSADRRELASVGVAVGRRWATHRPTLDHAPARRMLWWVATGQRLPGTGAGDVPWRARWPDEALMSLGFVGAEGWILRTDVAERAALEEGVIPDALRRVLRSRVVTPHPAPAPRSRRAGR